MPRYAKNQQLFFIHPTRQSRSDKHRARCHTKYQNCLQSYQIPCCNCQATSFLFPLITHLDSKSPHVTSDFSQSVLGSFVRGFFPPFLVICLMNAFCWSGCQKICIPRETLEFHWSIFCCLFATFYSYFLVGLFFVDLYTYIYIFAALLYVFTSFVCTLLLSFLSLLASNSVYLLRLLNAFTLFCVCYLLWLHSNCPNLLLHLTFSCLLFSW